MSQFDYLILGGGMAADAAAKAIRQIDRKSSVGIVSADIDPPYKRPYLSKKLWTGKPEESAWLHTAEQDVTLHTGRNVVSLDAHNKRLTDSDGGEYGFGKLLIATGGTPRRLPFEAEGIIYFRTFEDYRRLRRLSETGDSFAVIGGGFIGSEIAAALAMNGKHVTMLFPDTGIGAKVYPRELSGFLVDYFRERDVQVFGGDTATDVEARGSKYLVRTQGGREITVDGVIAGIGITPNTELAESAGIVVDNGIHVDEFLRTEHPDIYAAGDVANFYSPSLDKRMRFEHEDNAVIMGGYAGRAMAGQAEPYHYLPYFYSDLFDLGYEAVGELDAGHDIVSDWEEPCKKGVIYYMRDSRVRGVLLWNVWDSVPAARELIAQSGPFSVEDLKGRIAA